MFLQNLKSFKYNHADMLLTVALFALIYFAWRSAAVDLSSFGTGVATIFAGRGAHAFASTYNDSGDSK